ncbi:MAG TPA: LLM class flavin-dependent oxidoreductase [Candidatus Sulfotelmatobacter sp.]|nr:LLM class flavin-dependent oxidoreductase [Candidatus Sulfotelmatobacter sp.]
MEFGLGLFPTESVARMVELARLGEALGYHGLWFGDSHLIWREVYVTMGAAARATTRATLGTAVTNPLTRHVTVTASAAFTLHELSGGRAIVGIGAGDSGVRTFGGKPARLADLERAVLTIRALHRGETVDTGEGTARIVAAKDTRIPIYIAGSGPKILELAGRVCDGAIILVGLDEPFIRGAIACVHKGAHAAGRDPASIRTVLWVPAALMDDQQATQSVKAHIARIIIRPLPVELGAADLEVVRAVKASYDYYRHMDEVAGHGQVVPDSMVHRFALTGDPARIREQVKSAFAAGINQVAIIPYGTPRFDREVTIRAFADQVMAKL